MKSYKKNDFGAVQKFANLVELEKRCKMTICLQKSASIQLKADRLKFPGGSGRRRAWRRSSAFPLGPAAGRARPSKGKGKERLPAMA